MSQNTKRGEILKYAFWKPASHYFVGIILDFFKNIFLKFILKKLSELAYSLKNMFHRNETETTIIVTHFIVL